MLLQGDLASFPSDSPKQQEAVWAVAATDAYQWGYDPVHWGVPEGSYSTDPDDPARILEYRCVACLWRWLANAFDVAFALLSLSIMLWRPSCG